MTTADRIAHWVLTSTLLLALVVFLVQVHNVAPIFGD